MKKSYIVDSTCSDMRLDRWLRFKIGKIPQGLLEKYLRTGKIKLNKKKVKSSIKVKTKDEINIFNRWGDIVFKTNNYDESWDGTFKGENLPQAVYTYKITYKTRRGIDKQERGDIVLVK